MAARASAVRPAAASIIASRFIAEPRRFSRSAVSSRSMRRSNVSREHPECPSAPCPILEGIPDRLHGARFRRGVDVVPCLPDPQIVPLLQRLERHVAVRIAIGGVVPLDRLTQIPRAA